VNALFDPPPAPQLQFAFSSALSAPTQVFNFDGNASISQASVDNFPTSGLTISCWLKTTATQVETVLFSYDAKPGDNSHRLWIKNPGNIEVGFGASSAGPTGVAFNDGTWHQLAITLSPSDAMHFQVQIIKDGMQAFFGAGAISRPSGTILETGGALVLGQGAGAPEVGLVGQMSEFCLWSGVQSAAAIMTGMQVRRSGHEPGLVIYWQLTSPATSGHTQGGSFGPSDLQFRVPSLLAQWSSVANAQYDLQVVSSDGCWRFSATGLTDTQLAVTGYAVNRSYSAEVRAVVGGTQGAWSAPVNVLVMDLQPTVATVANPSGTTLQANWPAVDQAQQYQVALYQNQSTTPSTSTQTGTSYDLTQMLQGADSWGFQFSALSMGSFGPRSGVTPLQPVDLSFDYFDDVPGAGYLQAMWRAQAETIYYYLQISNVTSGNQPIVATILDGNTTSYRVAAQVNEGDRYSARIRAVAMGTIGAWTPLIYVTVHNMVAPLLTSVTADGAAHTVRLEWSFQDPSAQNPVFNLELWRADGAIPLATAQAGNSPYTFNDPAIIDGAGMKVRAQAVAGGSMGRWSEFTSFVVGAPPQVTGVFAGADLQKNVTVRWQGLNIAGVTYKVNLQGPGVNQDKIGIAGNEVTFPYDETHVQSGMTYQATVWAVKGGLTGPPSKQTPDSQVTINDPTPVPAPNQPNNPWWSDPINVATGTYGYSHVDLAVNSVVPLIFTTSYNTATPTPSENRFYDGRPLGNRWNHVYNVRIVKRSDNAELYLIWGTGQVVTYLIPNSITGAYPIRGVPDGSSLFLGADMIFVLTTKSREEYRFTFDGRLTQIKVVAGNILTLSYDGDGQLNRVTDPQTGKYLAFDYDNNGYLRRVSDKADRGVSYGYLDGNLTSITDVMNKTRSFDYYDNSMLRSATDENGHVFVTNVYTGGKVTFQQDARAVAEHQSYGSALVYNTIVEDGVEIVVSDVTDRAGNQARFKSVKANGNMLSAVYQLGGQNIRALTYAYDGFNNLLTETYYEGPSSQYTPDKGNLVTYRYDGNGNLTQVIDQLNRTADYSYNNDNQLESYTDFNGNSTRYAYQNGLLSRVTPALGGPTIFEYWDGPIKGLIKTITDTLGNQIHYEYQDGMLSKLTNPLGQSSNLTWDAVGLPKQITALDSGQNILRTVSIDYYSIGWVQKQSTQFQGQSPSDAFTELFTYDSVGNVQTSQDAVGNVMTYRYDPNDLAQLVTYPEYNGLKRNTSYEYDRIDNLTTATFSAEVIERYVYDQFSRLRTFTDGNSKNYRYSYTMLGLAGPGPYSEEQATVFPPLAASPERTFSDASTHDAAGRLIQVKDRSNNVTTFDYSRQLDPTTQTYQLVVTATLPPANPGETPTTIRQVFDAVGRIVSVQDQARQVTSYEYRVAHDPVTGANQSVVTVTDPLLNETIYTFDALGQFISFQQGVGTASRRLEYKYDALGRLIQVAEDQGTKVSTTSYTYQFDSTSKALNVTIGSPGDAPPTRAQQYNGLGQLVKDTGALNQAIRRSYTPWGSLASYTNALDQVINYTFDAAGRLQKTFLPGNAQSITQLLDGNGNRYQTMAGEKVEIRRTFDEWNRLKTRAYEGGKTIGYDYWPTDQVKTIFYSDNKQVNYLIDGLQRLKAVTDWRDRITSYDYGPTGLVKKIHFPNGTSADFNFDNDGRLTGLSHTKNNLIIARLSYALDALGNPTTCSAIYPLAPPVPTAQLTFTYNAANQIATLNGRQLGYDPNGNLSGLPINGQLATLGYDIYKRVTSLGDDTYGYDVDGFRVATRINGVSRKYLHDVNNYSSPMVEMADPVRAVTAATQLETSIGPLSLWPEYGGNLQPVPFALALDHVLEISDEAGNTQYRYVYGLGLISQEEATGRQLIYHADNLGNTLARTDEAGEIVDRYAYGPFGQLLAQIESSFNPFRYDGRDGVMDDGNGLYYMRARSYAPGLMSFLQQDYLMGDIGYPQTLNGYAFVAGNPITSIDPLGLSGWKDVAGAIVGALAVGGAIAASLVANGGTVGTVIGGGGVSIGGSSVFRILTSNPRPGSSAGSQPRPSSRPRTPPRAHSGGGTSTNFFESLQDSSGARLRRPGLRSDRYVEMDTFSSTRSSNSVENLGLGETRKNV
jgi:RHS repeat-associated protein